MYNRRHCEHDGCSREHFSFCKAKSYKPVLSDVVILVTNRSHPLAAADTRRTVLRIGLDTVVRRRY